RVALARMGGRTVGLVAAAGKLTAGAMSKAARFVRFMDCFGIPVVSLLNTCGVEVSGIREQAWLFKAQSQLLYAYAEATVPKLAVVTGDAIGQAYVAMGGKANADVTYAWPSAVISALTPEAAVAVLYGDAVKADKKLSVDEARAKYADQYIGEVAGAVNAAKQGMVDDIIDPAQTRVKLISALEMLASKRDSNPPKKHGNLPM
ncbi:MAG: carboxyl transferase domain-containing protein, partial [Clostridia bacterium]